MRVCASLLAFASTMSTWRLAGPHLAVLHDESSIIVLEQRTACEQLCRCVYGLFNVYSGFAVTDCGHNLIKLTFHHVQSIRAGGSLRWHMYAFSLSQRKCLRARAGLIGPKRGSGQLPDNPIRVEGEKFSLGPARRMLRGARAFSRARLYNRVKC